MVDVISLEAACELLGCKRRRVFQLLADGTLERAPRFGRSLRIYRASVERALTPTPAKRRAARMPTRAGWSKADFADLLTA
jgi:excisionase family DNA binding protein